LDGLPARVHPGRPHRTRRRVLPQPPGARTSRPLQKQIHPRGRAALALSH
jgi:hypothetical protein